MCERCQIVQFSITLQVVLEMVSGEKSLWVKIVESRYGSFSRVSNFNEVYKNWSLWWRGLYELWCSPVAAVGNLFWDKLSFVLENGSRVKFWVDPWLAGKGRMKDRFPRLFELSIG